MHSGYFVYRACVCPCAVYIPIHEYIVKTSASESVQAINDTNDIASPCYMMDEGAANLRGSSDDRSPTGWSVSLFVYNTRTFPRVAITETHIECEAHLDVCVRGLHYYEGMLALLGCDEPFNELPSHMPITRTFMYSFIKCIHSEVYRGFETFKLNRTQRKIFVSGGVNERTYSTEAASAAATRLAMTHEECKTAAAVATTPPLYRTVYNVCACAAHTATRGIITQAQARKHWSSILPNVYDSVCCCRGERSGALCT
ncbi:unnamed protein product [Trichogramma brassicae]|uniref:Uncharacterized protein n=1 Tax=Trichogramma brassicae TaxID=86971 RepID=A0A6H5IAD2_9HYME|nr:unnamed protein product [Trichogramma brassicae]